MNNKNWLFIFLACTFALTFNACKKSEDSDTTDTGPTEWVKSTVFTGDPRSNAAYFQIGDKGYIVGGILKNNARVNDAWQFSNSQWSPIADFPGEARHSAIGFSVGNKGYVGLGYNGTNALSDFYEYDPATNTWTEVTAELPVDKARYGAVAFSLGNAGYVGLGSTETGKNLSDMYRFNPSTKTWTVVPAQFKSKRANAFAFVIGNKAYVGGGMDNNQFPEDFYSFDGENWAELNPINRSDDNYTYDITRQSTATFAIGNYGYVVGGRKNSVLGNVWKYDPATDSWTDKHQAFLGSYRESAASFSIGGKGYVVTGMNGTAKFDDNWVFTPVR
ncbi:MAG TPA: kelch repeat-containing protein [Sphingobacterium sp.]|nr:kelch repeat-containing protein [Sphingobacterium sp.]